MGLHSTAQHSHYRIQKEVMVGNGGVDPQNLQLNLAEDMQMFSINLIVASKIHT